MNFIWLGDRFLNLDRIREVHLDDSGNLLVVVWADGDRLALQNAMAVGLFNALATRAGNKNWADAAIQEWIGRIQPRSPQSPDPQIEELEF